MKRILTIIAVVAIGLVFFTSCETSIEENGVGKHKGHEYVDLGLPSGLKWATCNVGADTPEEYGGYFAWGEVKSKEYYDWSTYKYGVEANKLTKYCDNSNFGDNGFADNKTVLASEDDAAAANWGGKWRMPTAAEQDELRNNCTWTWTTQNGVNGYKVTGPNGNSIFLPAAGTILSDELQAVEEGCFYWSSSLVTGDHPGGAYGILFDSSYVDSFPFQRCYGFSVRPVCP